MATKAPANPNQSVGLIAFFLIVGGFLATYYILAPQLTTARTKQAEAKAKLDGLNADIKTLETAKQDMGKAMDDLTAKGVDFSALRTNFPLTESIPDVYLQVEDVITLNPSLRKVDYQIGQPVLDLEGKGVRIPITMTATGTYGDLKNLLVSMETNIRPFILSQVSLATYTPSQDDRDIPSGAYVASLTGYTLSEKLSASYATTTSK